jgi:hypothetical protein
MAPDRETRMPEPTPEPGLRRPYRRPEITFQEALEAFATVCVPGKSDPVSCPSGPIAS